MIILKITIQIKMEMIITRMMKRAKQITMDKIMTRKAMMTIKIKAIIVVIVIRNKMVNQRSPQITMARSRRITKITTSRTISKVSSRRKTSLITKVVILGIQVRIVVLDPMADLRATQLPEALPTR